MPYAGRLSLKNGVVVIEELPASTQAGPSAPRSVGEQENGEEQAHPPQARVRRPATVRKAPKKRKASELDEESGGEVENERKSKVYTFLSSTCSPLLICDVFYRELSGVVPDSAKCLL